MPLSMFDFSMTQKDGMNPTDMSQKQADRSVDPSGSFAVALGTLGFQCQFQNNLIQVENFIRLKKRKEGKGAKDATLTYLALMVRRME